MAETKSEAVLADLEAYLNVEIRYWERRFDSYPPDTDAAKEAWTTFNTLARVCARLERLKGV